MWKEEPVGLPMLGAIRKHESAGQAVTPFNELVARYFKAPDDISTYELFSALYRALNGHVVKIALGITGDRARANEYAQEAWIRLSQMRHNDSRAPDSLLAWMPGVLVNKHADEKRHDRVAEKHSGSIASHFAQPSTTPEDALLNAEARTIGSGFRIDYESALCQLSDAERQVWSLMHDLGAGCSGAEAAEALGLKHWKVYELRERARVKLTKLLRKYWSLSSRSGNSQEKE